MKFLKKSCEVIIPERNYRRVVVSQTFCILNGATNIKHAFHKKNSRKKTSNMRSFHWIQCNLLNSTLLASTRTRQELIPLWEHDHISFCTEIYILIVSTSTIYHQNFRVYRHDLSSQQLPVQRKFTMLIIEAVILPKYDRTKIIINPLLHWSLIIWT